MFDFPRERPRRSGECAWLSAMIGPRARRSAPEQRRDSWGAWVSLSRENFSKSADLWDTPGRETEKPYFGRLTTDLPVYPTTTLNLKTHVHTRPVGERPFVELEPTDHPLAVEQRTGITLARVREMAATVLHSGEAERQ